MSGTCAHTCTHDKTCSHGWSFPKVWSHLEGFAVCFSHSACGIDTHALCAGHGSARAVWPSGGVAHSVSLSPWWKFGCLPVCHILGHFPWCTSEYFYKKEFWNQKIGVRGVCMFSFDWVPGLWAGQHGAHPRGITGEFSLYHCNQEREGHGCPITCFPFIVICIFLFKI